MLPAVVHSVKRTSTTSNGFDETHALRDAARAERAVVARALGEQLFELGDHRSRESASDLARVVQHVAVVVADEQ